MVPAYYVFRINITSDVTYLKQPIHHHVEQVYCGVLILDVMLVIKATYLPLTLPGSSS